jgi:hypothetical protein
MLNRQHRTAIAACFTLLIALPGGLAQAKSPQQGGLPAAREDLDRLVDALCDGDLESCEMPACPCFDEETLSGASTCFIAGAVAPFRGTRTYAVGPDVSPIGVSVGVPNVCEYVGPVPQVIGPISPAEAVACQDLILDLFGPACFGTSGP